MIAVGRKPVPRAIDARAGAELGSDWRGALALARDWSAILLAAWAAERLGGPWAYAAAVAVIGAFQFAIGEALLHEASHYHLFGSRALNEVFEPLYALPFFMTLAQFRAEHLAHHRDVGTPRDNLLADYRFIGLLEPRPNMFWLWFVKPWTGFAAYFYLTKLSLRPAKDGVKIIMFWALALGAAWKLSALKLLALYWLVPMAFGHAVWLYWSEIQDHYGTVYGTRTVLGALNNWLFHNNGYHAVHHAIAWVPFYNLRRAHAEFVADRGAAAGGDLSTGFLDTYRQLRAFASAAK